MRTMLASLFAAILLLAGAVAAQAPLTSPIGLWRTIDDKSGEVRGAVRLFESNGILYGRIERVIDPRAIGQVCDKCTDDRHNKPILGLDVIRGLHPDGSGSWSGGEILDPENWRHLPGLAPTGGWRS